ncbi:DNA polymerase Y family protein [Flavitalea sp. BT771]|uniref:Y-family DNA polymerase n=1 Tax=Flavitalea sp. BT771 TaxID=3063329 RepID=UPI0026E44B3A|nr:DNA polymerase Y family protein [Flavitalea sp. BT771]MDO6430342.1 DNA polymerase Y family protein [Flavitalea sp. BT771]MDV6219518.1 DNA polymerase Y family protein [Flavitalea sp. BT771]
MHRRFMTIWFRHLTTDWLAIRQPALRQIPFVLAENVHGRKVITAANILAQRQGIDCGMVVADARAIFPSLEVLDDVPDRAEKLLMALARWTVRYTPVTAIDPPDGLILEVTGCAHLWGGEAAYLQEITTRLATLGYDVRAAMAGTIGAAWAMSRFGQGELIAHGGSESTALLNLPPAALRLSPEILDRLHPLGLNRLHYLIAMPRAALRRRFGPELLLQLDRALGRVEEMIQPVEPPVQYRERLPCLEPIATRTGIEIALSRLLDTLCHRLQSEEKGLRTAAFTCHKLDGKAASIAIGTHYPSHRAAHLYKLFEEKIASLAPDPGIELFTLEAPVVEDCPPGQIMLWKESGGVADPRVAELLDRLAGKMGESGIHRYLPDEHYWPERSIKLASSLQELPSIPWPADRPRPIRLLKAPVQIGVTAPIPDYPPMLFRYLGKVHRIKKADGPERIEQEWWLEKGPRRDYYQVEDEEGQRYWIFRSGPYKADQSNQWFLHGFFA